MEEVKETVEEKARRQAEEMLKEYGEMLDRIPDDILAMLLAERGIILKYIDEI